LLITVRRAILRVAFLAEVVLAIVSNPLALNACFSVADRARRPLEGVIDAAGVSERSRACRLPEPNAQQGYAQRTAAAGLHPPPSAPL